VIFAYSAVVIILCVLLLFRLVRIRPQTSERWSATASDIKGARRMLSAPNSLSSGLTRSPSFDVSGGAYIRRAVEGGSNTDHGSLSHGAPGR
jgi:hypothetical protein